MLANGRMSVMGKPPAMQAKPHQTISFTALDSARGSPALAIE